MKKAALYGLAGNPPHKGHWGCVRELAQAGYFVIVSPSAAHAFGKRMAPYAQRVSWARMGLEEFCADLSGRVALWDGEERLRERLGADAVYSIDALRELAPQWPEHHLELAVGPDNADPAVFKKFKDSQAILSEFGLVALSEQDARRSTQIRELMRELQASGSAELRAELERCVGRSVAASLEGLGYEIEGGYAAKSAGPRGALA